MLPPSVPLPQQQRSNLLVLLALVLGLVLGATAVGMIWFVSGRTASATEMPTDASRDAQAACALLGEVSGYRLAGAASLAQDATAQDPHYRALSDALQRAARQYPNGRQASAALANARSACADL